MLTHKIALAGAAAVAFIITGSPAFAFTHHPATPAEIQATDDLNAKALADARAAQPAQPTASVNPQPSMNAPTATTPSPDMSAPAPSPTAPSATAPAAPDAPVTPDNGMNKPADSATPAPASPTQPDAPANGQ